MEIEDIVQKHDLKLLVLFGSHGTPRAAADSDVDLGFLCAHPLSVEEIEALQVDLMMCFRKGCMDLVDLRRAAPLLAFEIACTGRPLYERDEAFLHFKLHASARYADTRHLRDARRQFLDRCIDGWDTPMKGDANAWN